MRCISGAFGDIRSDIGYLFMRNLIAHTRTELTIFYFFADIAHF